MNNLSKTLVVAALAAFVPPATINAGIPASATQNVPYKMNYQGVLVNPANGANYVDGIYTLDIRIWSDASSTSDSACLWGGQYSVYVKDGYFNLMLGDASGKDLSSGVLPKYNNGNLWKAMWGANPTDVTYYLGVTPHESATHTVIASPSEIQPRQNLLTSPFAFRAQQAQYAKECNQSEFLVQSNLTVNGSTTLKGTVTFNGQVNATGGTQTLGPVKTTSGGSGTTVNLGNGYTSATADNRTSLPYAVYDVGQYLYFKSYYGMSFSPTAGDATFNIPSGRKMSVTGSGSFISDVPVNTIGGTSTSTVKGSSVYLQSGAVKKISVNSTSTVITNTTVNVEGNSVNVKASAGVFGQGPFYWAAPNGKISEGCTAPFQIRNVTVTVRAGASSQTANIEMDGKYNWVMVGYAGPAGVPGPNEIKAYKLNSTWVAKVYLASSATSDQSWVVTVMGVHKDFVNDAR